ncbi:MAG TPA: hypothetical protein VM492_12160, partial [Sumerlaeia bacterium]|nr:hypothetical protein [Sumerlaeia bacterium]
RGDRVRATGARMVLMVLMAGVALVAAYSPWLARAFVYCGSPFPPLTHPRTEPLRARLTLPWFGAGGLEEAVGDREAVRDREAVGDREGRRAIARFMSESHRPASVLSLAYARSLAARAPEAGALLLGAAILLAVSPLSDRRRRGVAILALAGYLVWNSVPHAADRFLAPIVPALAAAGVLAVDDFARAFPRWGRWSALPFALWVAFLIYVQTLQSVSSGWLTAGLGGMTREEFLEKQTGVTGRFLNAINAAVENHPNPRVLLVYEARSGAVTPRAGVVSNTVFDPSPLWTLLRAPQGEDPERVLEALRSRGITHVAVNEVELARLLATYPATPARADPAWRRADGLPATPMGFQPAFLALRRYYPPYYYFGAGGEAVGDREEGEVLLRRLDRFMGLIRQNAIWEEEIGPFTDPTDPVGPVRARLWVAQLDRDARMRISGSP